jgi:hypothetical protein
MAAIPMNRAQMAVAILLLALSACSKDAGDAAINAEGQPAADMAGVPSAQLANGKMMQPAQPLPPGVWRVQPVQIMDPAGFGAPMVASTAVIPAGWNSEGGIVWGAMGQCGADFTYQWQAVAPDGGAGFALLPTGNWTYAETQMGAMQPQQGGCMVGTYSDARQYLEAYVKSQQPDAQIVNYKSRPDRAKLMIDFYAGIPTMQLSNMREQRNIDAGELEITYSMNGRPMRAIVGTTVVASLSQWTDMMNPGQISQQLLNGSATGVYIARGPQDQFDPSLADLVLRSIRATPEWGTKTFEYNMEKMRRTSQAMTDRHNINMDTLRKQSEIMNGAYRNQDLASDRNQREFVESIRGVETYYDPVDRQPVQFDYTYKDAWRINDGTFVLTNDPSFDPQRYNLDGVQLKVIE